MDVVNTKTVTEKVGDCEPEKEDNSVVIPEPTLTTHSIGNSQTKHIRIRFIKI